MSLTKRRSASDNSARDVRTTPAAVAEKILVEKIEDIATIMAASEQDRSRLYEDVLSMVERGLVRIALRRSNNVKSAAAAYLGINRNTLQNKMIKLGIEKDPE
jgi:DNA-binding protein Fis